MIPNSRTADRHASWLQSERLWNVILVVLLLAMTALVARDFLVEREAANEYQAWNDEQLMANWDGFFQYQYTEQEKADWKFDWRLQDTEEKLRMQKSILADLSNLLYSTKTPFSKFASFFGFLRASQQSADDDHSNATSRVMRDFETVRALLKKVEDTGEVYTIGCTSQEGRFLRVGQNDFNTKDDAKCRVHGASFPPHGVVGPHYLWEKVDLGEEFIGFRSLANDLFLKMVPPSLDESTAEWATETISPLPGLSERFQIREEPGSGSRLYSELMKDYIQCPQGGVSASVKGQPGSMYFGTSSAHVFQISKVSREVLDMALKLKDMDGQIRRLHENTTAAFIENRKQQKPEDAANLAALSRASIAITIPMTSKGTTMLTIKDSPFWFNTFQTFCYSIDWTKNTNSFTFYIGFDKGDAIYDTGDAWNIFRETFHENVVAAISWMGPEIDEVEQIVKKHISLKLNDFSGLEGAPSQVVNALMKKAYDDGHDYFYQINDDTGIDTKEWPLVFMQSLASNPVYPNMGVTGPTDSLNPRIFTHAFVHRTHIKIFGSFFPLSFKNWWSDDWISTVYGQDYTFRHPDVSITHNVQAQKSSEWNRYDIDYSAQYFLQKEIRQGFVTISRFLREQNLPGLALPRICGYAPSVDDIYAYRQFSLNNM